MGTSPRGTQIQATATTNSGSAITATLPGLYGSTTSIIGFDVTLGEAASAATVIVTITGIVTADGSNTLNYVLSASTTGQGGASIRLPNAIPAAAGDTAIVVSLPAIGGGSAENAINVYGYQG